MSIAASKIRLKLSSNKLDRTLLYVLVADEKSTLHDNIFNIANYINNNSSKILDNYNDNIIKIYLVENNERTEIPLHNSVSMYLNQNDHIFCEFEDSSNDKSNSEDQQDFKRSKTENEKSSNEMDISTDQPDVVILDQPRTKTLELFYQTLSNARQGRLPKKLLVNDSMSLLDLKKQLAKEMNEIITTSIGGYEEMNIENNTHTCRLHIEIPKGTMQIEISEVEKLSCIKCLISDMTEGDIEERNILDFVLNGIKLDTTETIKNIAKIQQAQGGTIQIFGGKNCFGCENLERFEIRINGEGALINFFVDASVEIDNSSLKHILTTLKTQTVRDLKILIGVKYLEKFVDLPFDWSSLVIKSQGKVLDDDANLLKSGLFEMSEIVVSSSWFESIKMRQLLIVPDKNVRGSVQFKPFELTIHEKFTISMIRKIIAKVTNFPSAEIILTGVRDVYHDDSVEVGSVEKLVLKSVSSLNVKSTNSDNEIRSKVLNISLENYFLHSTPLTDHMSLAEWGIESGSTIYPLVYIGEYNDYDTHQSDSFKADAAWRSFTSTTIASDLHASAFLSSLKVFIQYLRKNKYARYYVISKLKYFLVDFPPVLLALELLIRGTSDCLSFHKASIVQSIFIISRELCESSRLKMTDEQIGLNCRFVLNFLLPPVGHKILDNESNTEMELSFITITFGHCDNDAIDESKLILASPSMRDEAVIYFPNRSSTEFKMIKEMEEVVPSLRYDWAVIKSRSSPSNIFVLHSPINLQGTPPMLTMNGRGEIVVFTNESCGSKVLWSPLSGDDLNPSLSLPPGQVFEEKVNDDELETPTEVIVVCVDVSGSMSNPSDFQGDAIDLEYDSDDENWTWKTKDDAVEKKSSSKTDRTLDMEKLFERTSSRLRRNYNLLTLKSLAEKFTVEIVLRELVRIENWESTYDSDLYRAIGPFYMRFVEIITGTEKDSTEDEGLNVEDAEIPIDYVCPISKEIMNDPVVASDGFSYERKNINDWFSRCNNRNLRSPVTGGSLKNKTLTANNNLRSQINTWLGNAVTPGLLQTSNSEQAEISLRINVAGVVANNVLNVTVPRNCTVGALKIAIIRKSGGKINPYTLIFGASYLQEPSKTLEKYGIVDSSNIICRCSSNSTIDVTLGKNSTFSCLRSDTISSILFRNWLHNGTRPSSIRFFYDLNESGDNFITGHSPKDSDTLESLLNTSKYLRDSDNETKGIQFTISPRSIDEKTKYSSRTLKRIQTVQQLFHALLNRTQAYSLPHCIGLVTFGSTATYTCPITRCYDDFMRCLDRTRVNGDTALYDGINLASSKLEEYCNSSNLQCKKRIIVLSDGDDNKSQTAIEQLTKSLINHSITVDSFLIGQTSINSPIRSCSIATGGYQFKPNSIRQALSLFEQEPILNLSVREERQKLTTNGRLFNSQFNSRLSKPWDSHDSVRIKKESKLELKVKEIHEVPQVKNSTETVKRICKEIANLLRTPHSYIDIFPSEEDLKFWKVLITGPEDTVYSSVTFLCYVKFKDSYPLTAPEIRFVTPILHPNINHQGRVCHSIFDRNWTPDVKMSELFGVVFGLLLNPDVDDPLDSNLALSFYNDNGQYEADVMSAMNRLRESEKNREQWKAFLINDEK